MNKSSSYYSGAPHKLRPREKETVRKRETKWMLSLWRKIIFAHLVLTLKIILPFIMKNQFKRTDVERTGGSGACQAYLSSWLSDSLLIQRQLKVFHISLGLHCHWPTQRGRTTSRFVVYYEKRWLLHDVFLEKKIKNAPVFKTKHWVSAYIEKLEKTLQFTFPIATGKKSGCLLLLLQRDAHLQFRQSSSKMQLPVGQPVPIGQRLR